MRKIVIALVAVMVLVGYGSPALAQDDTCQGDSFCEQPTPDAPYDPGLDD